MAVTVGISLGVSVEFVDINSIDDPVIPVIPVCIVNFRAHVDGRCRGNGDGLPAGASRRNRECGRVSHGITSVAQRE